MRALRSFMCCVFPVGRKHESHSGAAVIVLIITSSDLLGEFMFLLFSLWPLHAL